MRVSSGSRAAYTPFGALPVPRTSGFPARRAAAMRVLDSPAEKVAWYSQPADKVASRLGVDPTKV